MFIRESIINATTKKHDKIKKKTHGGDTGEEKDIEKHLRKGIAI